MLHSRLAAWLGHSRVCEQGTARSAGRRWLQVIAGQRAVKERHTCRQGLPGRLNFVGGSLGIHNRRNGAQIARGWILK